MGRRRVFCLSVPLIFQALTNIGYNLTICSPIRFPYLYSFMKLQMNEIQYCPIFQAPSKTGWAPDLRRYVHCNIKVQAKYASKVFYSAVFGVSFDVFNLKEIRETTVCGTEILQILSDRSACVLWVWCAQQMLKNETKLIITQKFSNCNFKVLRKVWRHTPHTKEPPPSYKKENTFISFWFIFSAPLRTWKCK